MKKQFTEEQITKKLHEAKVVGRVREVYRKNNITEQTFVSLAISTVVWISVMQSA